MSELALIKENFFNVFWKIKNFSYAFEVIDSPTFFVGEDTCHLRIKPRDVECRLVTPRLYDQTVSLKYVLSFIPCDDSSPLSAVESCLKVSRETLFRTRRKSFLPEETLTIQLRLPVDCIGCNLFVQSQIGVKRKCFAWTLKDLESCYYAVNIITTGKSDLYGSIKMYLKRTEGIVSDEQFYIEVSKKNGEQCCCVLKISVLNLGEVFKCVTDEFLFKKQDGPINWKFPPIIKNSELLTRDDLTLSFQCDVAISLGKVTDETEVLGYFEVTTLPDNWRDYLRLFKEEQSLVSVSNLQIAMKDILDNEIFCDASLQISSQVVHAHKAILSGRSPVLKSLFMGDLIKNDGSSNIAVEGIEVDTFRQLLCYIYTDTINDYELDKIMKLYAAADKYQVPSLKQKCSAFLMANLSVCNFGEILALADRYTDKNLEESVIGFVSRNASEILASKAWKDLEELFE